MGLVMVGYRYVICRHCGKKQRFMAYHDEWGTDEECKSCGNWLGEYE